MQVSLHCRFANQALHMPSMVLLAQPTLSFDGDGFVMMEWCCLLVSDSLRFTVNSLLLSQIYQSSEDWIQLPSAYSNYIFPLTWQHRISACGYVRNSHVFKISTRLYNLYQNWREQFRPDYAQHCTCPQKNVVINNLIARSQNLLLFHYVLCHTICLQ